MDYAKRQRKTCLRCILLCMTWSACFGNSLSTNIVPSLREDDGVLRICECEYSDAAPFYLACEKQGWFIVSFENQGTWMGGGGLVPLSRALCCRPCLPGKAPETDIVQQMISGGSNKDRHDRAAGNDGSLIMFMPQPGQHGQTTEAQAEQQITAAHAVEKPAWTPPQENLQQQQQQQVISEGKAGSGIASVVTQPVTTRRLLARTKGREAKASVSTAGSARQAGGADNDAGVDDDYVGIISLGCHTPSASAYSGMTCEPDGASFVTGFSDSNRVGPLYPDIWYPAGSADCCTPALLTSRGDTLPLKRCNCSQAYSKDCGGPDSNHFLWGFGDWRVTAAGDLIPVAPLMCCSICMDVVPAPGPAPAPAPDPSGGSAACQGLNFCSGKGVCHLGACLCQDGWAGADCSQYVGDGANWSVLPWWATSLMVVGFLMIMFAINVAGRATLQQINLERGEGGQGQGGAPGTRPTRVTGIPVSDPMSLPLLLQYLDEEGSVGSQDTDDVHAETDRNGNDACGTGATEGTQQDTRGYTAPHVVVNNDDTAAAVGTTASQAVCPDDQQGTQQGSGSRATTSVSSADQGQALGMSSSIGLGGRGVSRDMQADGADVAPAGARASAGSTSSTTAEVDASSSQRVEGVTQTASEGGAVGAAKIQQEQQASEGPSGQHNCTGTHSKPEAISKEEAVDDEGVSNEGGSSGQGNVTIDMSRVQPGTCVVCMETAVQVALIPCGHACVCRKCSRRLNSCPLCRKLVGRRQKLFLGLD